MTPAPGTTVPPHHRGPYAGVLRLHVWLIVPPGDCAIRVEDTVLRWEEGRCLGGAARCVASTLAGLPAPALDSGTLPYVFRVRVLLDPS